MAAKKGWGSTVLGWFVVSEDDQTGGDASFSSENAAASSSAAAPIAFVKDPPPSPGGKVEFDAVYEAAGIEGEEQARVVKAAELLRALPAGTEPAVQKQIVAASLKAFGVPVEKIIEAAVSEVQALEGYIRAGAADTQKVLDESRKRIAEFEQDIARIKAVMEDRVSEQQAGTTA